MDRRAAGRHAEATDTPIGRLPTKDALDVEGLDLTDAQLDLLLSVDVDAWREEASLVKPHYERFGDPSPPRFWNHPDNPNQAWPGRRPNNLRPHTTLTVTHFFPPSLEGGKQLG